MDGELVKMRSLILLILIIFVNLSFVIAQTAPSLPTSYWGYVTNEDSSPKNGVSVMVEDSDGNIVGQTTEVTDSSGLYHLDVKWDDLSTNEDEGVVEGEKIIFEIDGKDVAEKTIAEKGSNNQLDLSYTESQSWFSKLMGGEDEGHSTSNDGSDSTTETKSKDLKTENNPEIITSPNQNEPLVKSNERSQPIKETKTNGWIITLSVVIIGLVIFFTFNKFIKIWRSKAK